jgi:hypothetical protein
VMVAVEDFAFLIVPSEKILYAEETGLDAPSVRRSVNCPSVSEMAARDHTVQQIRLYSCVFCSAASGYLVSTVFDTACTLISANTRLVSLFSETAGLQ